MEVSIQDLVMEQQLMHMGRMDNGRLPEQVMFGELKRQDQATEQREDGGTTVMHST